jgi:hypothetical protein
MDPKLGVAAGGELVTGGQESLADLMVVVKLAVEGDPYRAILVGHRLEAAREIHDRESPSPQENAGLSVDPLRVRAPVRDGTGHGQRPVDRELPAPIA